jgi:hypothetical protein
LAARKKPLLTNAARPATFEVEAYNERGEMVPTAIAGEHPLTLYLDKREIVTLMTLGHAPPRRSPSDISATSAWSTRSTRSRRCRSTGKPNPSP